MVTVRRKIGAVAMALALATSMSVTAFATESNSLSPPSNTGGGTPTLVQESGDGYSSITIYDGVSPVTAPQYTGEMQGDFQNIGEQPKSPRYYPFEITNVDERGTWLVVKSYEVPADVNADDLIETNMIREGKRYEARDILKKKTPGNVDSREASKKVTITSDTKDTKKIREKLDDTTFYSEGGYEGYLTLDEASITAEVSSTSNYSYNLTEKKEYTGLEKNDPSLIEKTITKNGVTLTLGDVNWVSMGSTVSGNSIVSTYKAVATYTGVAYGSKADGYIVNANYKGTATKHVEGDCIYSIIYAPIVETPEPPAEENKKWSLFGNSDDKAGGQSSAGQSQSTEAGQQANNEAVLGSSQSPSNINIGHLAKMIGLIILGALLIAAAALLIVRVIRRRNDGDEEDYYDENDEAEGEEDIALDDADPQYYAKPGDGTVNLSLDDDPELASEIFGGAEADGEGPQDEE